MACALTHDDAQSTVGLLRMERHSYFMLLYLAAYQLTLQHGLLHLLLHLLNLQLLKVLLLPKRSFGLLCLKQLEVDIDNDKSQAICIPHSHGFVTVRVQCLAKMWTVRLVHRQHSLYLGVR